MTFSTLSVNLLSYPWSINDKIHINQSLTNNPRARSCKMWGNAVQQDSRNWEIKRYNLNIKAIFNFLSKLLHKRFSALTCRGASCTKSKPLHLFLGLMASPKISQFILFSWFVFFLFLLESGSGGFGSISFQKPLLWHSTEYAKLS